jgi:hypothetical protein
MRQQPTTLMMAAAGILLLGLTRPQQALNQGGQFPGGSKHRHVLGRLVPRGRRCNGFRFPSFPTCQSPPH